MPYGRTPSVYPNPNQVHITYRYEGNAKLLLDYGFAEALALTSRHPGAYPSYEAVHLALPSRDEAIRQDGASPPPASPTSPPPPPSPPTAARAQTPTPEPTMTTPSPPPTLLLGTDADDEAALATLRRHLSQP